MDKIQPYRQPMVTASGIFLGFMLNFTSGWIRETLSLEKLRDVVVAIGITASLSLLLITLFRILRMTYHRHPDKYYRRTLAIFLIGIFIPFISFTIVIVEKFIVSFHK
jgi:hypothetical protein